MSDDNDHVVLTLPRGERGELRLSRSRYQGHTFTKFHLWYPTENGELRPGRQVVTIRDGELRQVIDALQRIVRKVGDVARATSAPAPRVERHTSGRQNTLPMPGASTPDPSVEGDMELF